GFPAYAVDVNGFVDAFQNCADQTGPVSLDVIRIGHRRAASAAPVAAVADGAGLKVNAARVEQGLTRTRVHAVDCRARRGRAGYRSFFRPVFRSSVRGV